MAGVVVKQHETIRFQLGAAGDATEVEIDARARFVEVAGRVWDLKFGVWGRATLYAAYTGTDGAPIDADHMTRLYYEDPPWLITAAHPARRGLWYLYIASPTDGAWVELRATDRAP